MIGFLRGVWEFIVGDDVPTAFGVAAALGITAIVAGAGISAWWVMAAAAMLLLGQALVRAARR